MDYSKLTDDELRVEVAKRSWLDGIVYPINTINAIALLDSMTYPDGLPVEYAIIKDTYNHIDNIDPLPAPVYHVEIFPRDPMGFDNEYQSEAAPLPRAICEAWLAWKDAQI